MIFSDSLLQNFTGERPVLKNGGKENPFCGDQKACDLIKTFDDTIFSIFQSLGHSTAAEKIVFAQKEVAFDGRSEKGQGEKLNSYFERGPHFPSPETKETISEKEKLGNPIGPQGMELPSLSRLHRLVRVDQEQGRDGTNTFDRELKKSAETGVGRLSVVRLVDDSPSTAAPLDKNVERTIDYGKNVQISETKGRLQKNTDEGQIKRSSTLEEGAPFRKPILAREPGRNPFVQHTEKAANVIDNILDTVAIQASDRNHNERIVETGGGLETGGNGPETWLKRSAEDPLDKKSTDYEISNIRLDLEGNAQTEKQLFQQEVNIETGAESTPADKKNGTLAISQETPTESNHNYERQPLAPFTQKDVETVRQFTGQSDVEKTPSSLGRDSDQLRTEATLPPQSVPGGEPTGHPKNTAGETRKEVNPSEKGKPSFMESQGGQLQTEKKSPLPSAPRSDLTPHFENPDERTQHNAESNPKVLFAGGTSNDRVTDRQSFDRTETTHSHGPERNIENRTMETKMESQHQPAKNVPVAEFSPSEEANPLEKAVSGGKGFQNETPEILKSFSPKIHHEPVPGGNKAGTSVFPEIDRDPRYAQISGSKSGASVQSTNSFVDGLNMETAGTGSAERVEAATPKHLKTLFATIDTTAEEPPRDLTKNAENAIRMKTVSSQQQSNDDEAIVPEHRYRGMAAAKESADGHKQMPYLGVERKAADKSENPNIAKKQPATDKNNFFKPADAEKVSEHKTASHVTDARFREKQRDFTSSTLFKNSETVNVKEEGSAFTSQTAGAKKVDNLFPNPFHSDSTNENSLGEKLPPSSFTPADESVANRTFESPGETDKVQHTGKEAPIQASADSANKPTAVETSSVTKSEQFLPDNLKSSVLDQLVGKASIRSLQNRSECTIRLQPEFLGNVRMTVTTLNEQVTIRIVTDQAFAKDSIESNLHLLKAELNNHGLTIDKFDVLSSTDMDQHSGRDQFAQTSRDQLSQNGRNQMEDHEPEKDERQKGKNGKEEEPRRDKRRQEYLKQNGISHFV